MGVTDTDGTAGTSSVSSGRSASDDESMEARMLSVSLGSKVGMGGVAATGGMAEGVATGEGR